MQSDVDSALTDRNGAQATTVRLPNVSDVAADGHGGLLVIGLDQHVYRIGSDGIISIFAGRGECLSEPVGPLPVPGVLYGDGGNARDACITNGLGVTVAPNGDVLIGDTFHSRVRRIAA